MKALVSIHDVMPHTMKEVSELIDICRACGVQKLTLLVVPGHDWSNEELDQIKRWQSEGCEIAAHGWHHKCSKISTIGHRLHSWILSRDVAEHLSLQPDEVAALMRRSKDWFAQNGFATPDLYVPPAWALGKISDDALKNSGFGMVETLSGIRLLASAKRRYLPLVGFEADTAVREIALRLFNGLAVLAAKNKPLRVSLHPYDHRLRLQRKLKEILLRCDETLSYRVEKA